MKRAELAHILRAAARIADPDMLVIGSQSIHGAVSEAELPELAMVSREADIAFWNDADDVLALVEVGLLDLAVLEARASSLPIAQIRISQIQRFLASCTPRT
ncbi:hypothetical protein [Microbacterium sp. 179-I 3D3 NHS]|uniref:hypothetical protein n=1 Tax=Microbacterium sp. 179-I 3D3 NHS TaxID=3142382 RepID=UPI0039A3AF05